MPVTLEDWPTTLPAASAQGAAAFAAIDIRTTPSNIIVSRWYQTTGPPQP